MSITTPEHLTLLMKCGKSTTVLSVLPDQSFINVKAMLLQALQSRNITQFPGSSVPLPSDPQNIELAVLVDKRDASKGWVSLDSKEQDVSDTKIGKKKALGRRPGPAETPLDANITDGYWLAYRLKSARDDNTDGEVPDIEMEDDPGWNVILPSYDDDQE